MDPSSESKCVDRICVLTDDPPPPSTEVRMMRTMRSWLTGAGGGQLTSPFCLRHA